MDILSLPDEMLVSVYKYTDDLTLIESRLLSKRIDQIAVRHKLNKVILEQMEFYIHENRIEVKIFDSQDHVMNQIVTFNDQTRDSIIFATVKNLYTKCRSIEEFRIWNTTEHPLVLTREFICMMLDSKKRRIKNLLFINLIIEWDASLMRRFLTTFKFKRLRLVNCETPNIGQHCSLFNELTFTELDISDEPQLSMTDLITICMKKIPSYMFVVCRNVTIRDALKFTVDVLKREKQNLFVNLNEIDFEGMSIERIGELLEPIKAVATVDIDEEVVDITTFDNEVTIYLYRMHLLDA